jgi:predicted dehydrogenase
MPNRTLFEGGVHLLDLLFDLYGELPEAVTARSSSGLDPERDADAIHLVLFEFPGNRLAQVTIDRLCPAGTRYMEVRADCEQASLRASLGGRAAVQIGKPRGKEAGLRAELASGASRGRSAGWYGGRWRAPAGMPACMPRPTPADGAPGARARRRAAVIRA